MNPRAWYREPFVLMIIGIPLTAVCLGIALVWIAVANRDDLVVDDYYRQGKEINRVLDRDLAAEHHGLRAILRINREEGRVELLFQAKTGFSYPASIELQMIHATKSDYDRTLVMHYQGEGRYIAASAPPGGGKWYLHAGNMDWRVSGSMTGSDVSVSLFPG